MPVLTYKCKNCSGELLFNPETQKFVCEYCNGSFTQSDLEKLEPKKDETKEAEKISEDTALKQSEDTNLYTCNSCGAEIVTDSTTAATFCYYCHNPVVLMGRLDGNFLPNRIIPFKINRSSAIDKFVGWTKKKHFVPKDFYSQDQIELLTGVYFPYWLVDSDSKSELTANAKKIRTWTTGKMSYTETSHYSLTRHGDIHLEDVIKTALKKANKKLVESVQPFDEKELQKFSMTFLSGFQAEKRDIEQADLENEVNADIKGYCEALLKGTMQGYSDVTPTYSNTLINNIAWEYTLLPVWAMTYKYKNETFYYAMNGQSGKTCGKLPVDMKKLLAVAGIISAISMVILSIGGYLI